MTTLKWLEGYSGESVDQLVALASEYRIDSILIALEQALQERAERFGLACLSEAERTVLAVEALEREVNNGGYHQFFLNAAEHAPEIVAALERGTCPLTQRSRNRRLGIWACGSPLPPSRFTRLSSKMSKGALSTFSLNATNATTTRASQSRIGFLPTFAPTGMQYSGLKVGVDLQTCSAKV